ncbi:MAG: aspartate-semialdehyde dehydrogenase [Ignavibacteria bacterium RIFOXYB2_FULL_35_12]|nr:MAG: aspartate-semialdehyde dehydrogenase [Ignavibacteria bacterium GWA2_36_19]OGU54863.1 MAG: aspartate-semialdehyde dehydrogenase [Ignavibacteria bacterium GWC2_35_8]OGU61714.1 MAG: aspartate-semialdehyde dehydrogenase [Ignavibacteria bacterium GWF2_35_20]OGU78571.1 MAG: aspartate-semialdehyde dehydrogenase [Ignavibacteria bacterium RIFOXYA2_FULL_35_9]OGU85615.1 MAG: aspartate-semialdehyde dehydrogenase [Ignavibacteria bacterium RIFOXYA12_FULL_35_25]OGU96288.1 MAG: aspartate-semialdehyde 
MKKIGVAILGATGSVGQKFLELLAEHPQFEVKELAASEKSAGKKYKEATNWIMQKALPLNFSDMIVKECQPNLKSKIVFSALDASVAGEIEEDFAKAGYIVISNARNHRYDPNVPLIIPEVNSDHLEMIKFQKYGDGAIITNPNCSTIGLVLALKPLHENFVIESVNVVTLQAVSGAGYPGLPSMDIIDNSIPFIGGEEPKMEKEPLKILGRLNTKGQVDFADIVISAQCNRVAVNDGHLECVQVKLKKKPSIEEMINSWINFKAEPQKLNLPSAPKNPIYYFHEEKYPQPKIHRNLEKGMAAAVGRLRECPLFDYKFVVLSHNTVRGAAGGTILIAELLHAKGYLPDE